MVRLKGILPVILCFAGLIFLPAARAFGASDGLEADMEKCARIAYSAEFVNSYNTIKDFIDINEENREEYSEKFLSYLDNGIIDEINKRVKLIYYMYRDNANGMHDSEYIREFFSAADGDDTLKFEKQSVIIPEEDITVIISALSQPLYYEAVLTDNGENDVKTGIGHIVLTIICVILAIMDIAVILLLIYKYLCKKTENNNWRFPYLARNKNKSSSNSYVSGNDNKSIVKMNNTDLFNKSNNESSHNYEKLKTDNENLNKKYSDAEDENKRLKKENDTLTKNVLQYQDQITELNKKISEQQESQQNVNKASDELTPTMEIIDIYNANVNEGKEIKLEKAALTIKDGRIAVESGGYVYIEPTENGLLLYPTAWIKDSTIREILSVYFTIEIKGGDRILLKKPCVLSRDMYGYIVVEKGLVILD